MQQWFQLAGWALKISIMIQLLAIGLGTNWREATYLFRQPALLLKSILARNVAVPIVAVLLIKLFTLRPAVAIALGVLALTPVPPLLPKGQLKGGGRSEYVLGLLVSQAVLSITLVPLTIVAMNWSLGSQAHFGAGQVAKLVIQSILIPLGVGILTARFFPKLKAIAPRLLSIGSVLMIVGAVPLLLVAWKAFGALTGNGTLWAMAIFVVAATAVGHFLGGPLEEDRTALAIAASARHPALAIAIARDNFSDQATLVSGAIIIYLLLRTVLSLPYVRLRRAP